MNRINYILLFVSCSLISISQSRIEGKITNEKSEAIPFCALVLLNAKDSTQVKGNITGEDGEFVFEGIKAGNYIIKASSAEHNEGLSAAFTFDSASVLKLDPLVLKTKAVNLNEVSVSVIKKPIEFKNGNIVVNVEGSPLAAGNSVYDLLMRMPGVIVDGDNISLKGKGGVRFLIDDRMQQLQGAQMTGLLKAMSASSVEKIELISNPPARYDAAGGGGLINIITKKVKITGFSGSAMINSTQGFYNSTFGALSLNYKGKKINVFTNYNAARFHYRAVNHWHREMQDSLHSTLDQDYLEKTTSQFASFFGGIDWYISKKHTLSLRTDFRPGSNLTERRATTAISNNSLGYENLAFNFEKPSNWFWQDYNLNYEFTPDTQGTKLNFNASYSTYPENYYASYTNHYLNAAYNDVMPVKIFKSKNAVDIGMLSAKLDFEKNMSKTLRVESGAKVSRQYLLSDFIFENKDAVTGQYSIDTALTNSFSYQEEIMAGYLDVSKEIKKFNLRAGLRGENTLVTAESRTNDYEYSRQYFNLFPVASIDYNPSLTHSWQLSYNRRINRPDYNNFNPYKAFRTMLTYVQGNPYLNPQYNNRIELGHTYKGKFSNSIGASIMKNYFFSYNRENIQTKELIFYNSNLDNAGIISYNSFMQTDIFKWWLMTMNLGVHYFYTSGNIDGTAYSTAALNTNVWMQQLFTIYKKTKLELNGWAVGPWVDGVSRNPARGALNVGIKQKFLKDKLDLSIGVEDVFYSMGVRTIVDFHTQYSVAYHQWDSRRAYIYLNYSFGKIKVQQKNLKRDNEEKDRVKRS